MKAISTGETTPRTSTGGRPTAKRGRPTRRPPSQRPPSPAARPGEFYVAINAAGEVVASAWLFGGEVATPWDERPTAPQAGTDP